jgi:HD-GYP domain-containing protein (c-di-GMP phosphodiesterase class II)
MTDELSDKDVDEFMKAEQQAELEDDTASDEAASADAEVEQVGDASQGEAEKELKTKPGQMVPSEALHQERERRKEERRLREELETRYEERFNKLAEALGKKDEPAAPKFEDSPDEFFRHQIDDLSKRVEETAKSATEQRQAREQDEQARNFQAAVVADERRFAMKQTDYGDVVQKYQVTRTDELRMMGYSDQEIGQTLYREASEIAQRAMDDDRSPAEVMYQIASHRVGKAESKGKLDVMEKGAKAAKGSGNGGSGGSGQMSAKRLMELSDDDFDKALANGDFRKAMGG